MGSPPATAGEIRLSRREMEVARLVAEGLTNREIAGRLFLSERTVDGHLEHVREKLNVNTRAQVAAWVVRQAEPSRAEAAPAARRTFRWAAIPRRWLWLAAVVLVAVEAAVVLAAAQPPQPTIVTVAGTQAPPVDLPVGGYTGDGGRAIDALLSLPSDVAVTADGTIYIADYRNKRIRLVSNGNIVTVAGGGKHPLADGQLGTDVDIGHASNVGVDSSGHPYFLTNDNGVLEVWTFEQRDFLSMVVRVGESDVEFGEFAPATVGGLAVGPNGTIYIADKFGNAVYSFTPGAKGPVRFAGTGQGGYSGDTGPATGLMLHWPAGLAVDRHGDVYIADSLNNRIRKVDTRGVITTAAGSGRYYGDTGDGELATQARLHSPYGVAVGRDGSIYIADTGNNRLREVTPSGTIKTVAGTGVAGYTGDGRAGQAELAAPEGLAIDGSGHLFVADTLNLRIREILGLPV